MNRSLSILAGAVALAALAAAGCSGNDASTVLVPTGIRPAPEAWPGSLTGSVFFDPVNTPDLAAPPYPPTRVELFLGATMVAVDSLEPGSRNYLFTGLAAGSYSIVVRSSAFYANSRGGLPVREGRLDAGNITLTLNPLLLSSTVFVTGTAPGFGADQIMFGTTLCNENTLGVFTYPGDFAVPSEIPAGTYRLKFVNDQSSSDGNLIGWGGSPAETLETPVTSHLAVYGSGPSTDLVVRFSQTGYYAFTLDERRQRFSIALVPPAPVAGPGR